MRNLINKNTVNLVFILIIILDLVILPVSPLFSLPYSLLLILALYVTKKNNIESKTKLVIYLSMIFIILSTIVSLFSRENVVPIESVNNLSTIYLNAPIENIKRCFYILFSFVVYIVISNLIKSTDRAKKYIDITLVLVCLMFMAFAALHTIDIQVYYKVKSMFFNMDVNVLGNEELLLTGYIGRFSFILLDPNTAGYYYQIIAFYLLENGGIKDKYKILIFGSVIVSVFLTRSLGGLISLLVYILYKLYKALNYFFIKNKRISMKRMLLIWTMLMGIFFVIALNVYTSNAIKDTFMNSQREVIDRWSNNSSNSRTDRYAFLLTERLPSFFGEGYVIVRDGFAFLPHSDHLRFLYSFGVLFYIAFLIFIVKNIRLKSKYMFIIPSVVAFSVNSLIDETRLLYTFMIVFAIVND